MVYLILTFCIGLGTPGCSNVVIPYPYRSMEACKSAGEAAWNSGDKHTHADRYYCILKEGN